MIPYKVSFIMQVGCDGREDDIRLSTQKLLMGDQPTMLRLSSAGGMGKSTVESVQVVQMSEQMTHDQKLHAKLDTWLQRGIAAEALLQMPMPIVGVTLEEAVQEDEHPASPSTEFSAEDRHKIQLFVQSLEILSRRTGVGLEQCLQCDGMKLYLLDAAVMAKTGSKVVYTVQGDDHLVGGVEVPPADA